MQLFSWDGMASLIVVSTSYQIIQLELECLLGMDYIGLEKHLHTILLRR